MLTLDLFPSTFKDAIVWFDLLQVPFPAEEQLRRTVQTFASLKTDKDYVKSLLQAYQDIGLLIHLHSESDRWANDYMTSKPPFT